MDSLKSSWPPMTDALAALESEEKNFGWEPCGCVIRGEEEGDWQCRADWDISALRIMVSMEKPFQWDVEKGGWRWHKTWRLPEIGVRIANQTGTHCAWEVRIHVVCGSVHPNELEDVGVSVGDGPAGVVSMQVVDGECRFARLRLQSTSNTRGGRRFHIVLSVLRRESSPGMSPVVVASLISSGFHVFSRKDADKKRTRNPSGLEASPPTMAPSLVASGGTMVPKGNEGLPQEFTLFSPELFEKTFIKKVSDHQGHTMEEYVDNSAHGLMNYFQAPNIRFKSRHPILLAVRFSNALCVMRDVTAFLLPNERSLRAFFCACGFPPNCSTPDCVSCALKRGVKSPEGNERTGVWYMGIRPNANCSPQVRQWLFDHLKYISTAALVFVPDVSVLPPKFASTDIIEDIERLYRRMYLLESSPGGEGDGAMMMETHSIPLKAPAGEIPIPTAEDLAVSNEMEAEVMSWDVSGEPVKGAFAEFFIGLHSEIRILLARFTEAASEVVANFSADAVRQLQDAYYHFSEVLAVHTFVEDSVLFPELARRVPGVTEAYNFDHYKESDHLTRIYTAIGSIELENSAELFLSISGFAAIHNEHLEKEEEHLLPYMLTVFSDDEMSQLMLRCSEAARVKRDVRGEALG